MKKPFQMKLKAIFYNLLKGKSVDRSFKLKLKLKLLKIMVK